ncbi:hypothetical protein [Paludibacterium purpuratum]|uniref:Uncharacterized protein n=1 Tax=Paludibacterium purpuratum TaxID=1144873 RepID=A0A4V3DVT1_9NEIS|nr:hypothetical protein [Paludibacterium purpuratum]TDR82169.1 hypothetical protein DFP86_102283 [Paludibacterium purpuratum]
MSENAIIDQLHDRTVEENEVAQEFLLGELIKAATKPMREMAVTWAGLSEREQENVLRQVHLSCESAVRKAVVCIAAGNRVNFRAAVETVQFKPDGVKAQLTMVNCDEAHELANYAERTVMIVIEDGSDFLKVGDALDGEPDQPALFDDSTGGQLAA